jgi:hypothetical protein
MLAARREAVRLRRHEALEGYLRGRPNASHKAQTVAQGCFARAEGTLDRLALQHRLGMWGVIDDRVRGDDVDDAFRVGVSV